MILNRCRICRCPTDPAETVCDDCRKKMEAAEQKTGNADMQQGEEDGNELQGKG